MDSSIFGIRPTAVPVVSGRNLAQSKRTATARAFLVADVIMGRIRLVELTATQLAAIADVSSSYVQAALAVAAKPEQRRRVDAGFTSLGEAAKAARPSHKPKQLLNSWISASERERIELIRTHQVQVWDLLDQMTASDDGMPVPKKSSALIHVSA